MFARHTNFREPAWANPPPDAHTEIPANNANLPNHVRQPTEDVDLAGEMADATFEGVMQRTRNFETIY